ncbi:MAG: DUF4097 domain-containing protein [Coprococcus sp.]|nr:DUF4097 domain-containing protein [Coprococcus sp.]
MRRGWKIFWIIVAVLTGLGIACCAAALALGISSSQIREIYPDGIGFFQSIHTEESNLPEDVEAKNEGEVSVYEDITSLEADIGGYELKIRPSEDEDVRVDTTDCWFGGDTEIAVYEKNGRLYIKTVQSGEFLDVFSFFTERGEHYGEIRVYLPTSLRLTEAELSIGAAEVEIDTLKADKTKISIGAADCHIQRIETEKADIMVGGGDLELAGKIDGDITVKCGAGDVDLELKGGESDYNYDVVCGAGEVEIGEAEYGGAASTKRIDNGSSRTVDIKCGAGKVEISFKKEDM